MHCPWIHGPSVHCKRQAANTGEIRGRGIGEYTCWIILELARSEKGKYENSASLHVLSLQSAGNRQQHKSRRGGARVRATPAAASSHQSRYFGAFLLFLRILLAEARQDG
jgi:hypothetical protein